MTETKKIVLIKNTQYGITRIITQDEIKYLRNDEFSISLPADVEFEMLPKTDQVNDEIDALNCAKEEVLAEAQAKATLIEDKIQSLLAIESK